MVGHAPDHEGDCCRMWDPNTERVHQSRDVIWPRRMFYQRQLPATDLAIEPIEFDTPDTEAREGTDIGDDADFGANANEPESDDNDEQQDDDDGAGAATLKQAVAQWGRAVNPPKRFVEEMGAISGEHEIGLSVSELRHYALMREFPEGEFAPGEVVCVGAGLGGGFEDASELHVMKHKRQCSPRTRKTGKSRQKTSVTAWLKAELGLRSRMTRFQRERK